MPFYVDDRRGSGEFLRPLVRMGIPATIKRLRFADFAFTLKGPHGSRLRIGVERKTVTEMLAVGETRFTGKQLPGLFGKEQGLRRYDVVVLIVEGLTTIDPDGVLMEGRIIRTKRGKTIAVFDTWKAGFGRGYHVYESYKKRQLTLAIKAHVIVEYTKSKTETAHLLHALYRWGQKDWSKHMSAYKVEAQETDTAILDERTIKRQTFAQWPGVGWTRSAKVSRYFPSIAAAVAASEREWMRALQIREGRKTVQKLIAVLHGKGDGDAKAT